MTFNKYSSVLWIGILAFAYSQLKEILPVLSQQVNQLWGIINGVFILLRGPLKEYFLEWLEDLDEANPEFVEKM